MDNNISYQVALGVVIPVLLIIIIILLVLFYVQRNHPTMLRKSTANDQPVQPPQEQPVHYENQVFHDATRPQEPHPSNTSESAYDHIDTEDIDMHVNVYDLVDTDRVEYEIVAVNTRALDPV